MKRRASKKLEKFTIDMKRNVFNYKYRGRNLRTIAVTVALLGVFGVGLKVATTVDAPVSLTVYEEAAIDMTSIDAVKDMVSEPSTEVAEVTTVAEVAPQTTSEFDNKVIVSSEGSLNIRSEANTEAEVAGQMNTGDVGEIISVEGEWTKIKSGDVEGYVKTEYVLTGEEAEEFAVNHVNIQGTICDEGVRVRKEASTDSEIVQLIDMGTKVTVLDDGTQKDVDENVEGLVEGQEVAPTGTPEVIKSTNDVTQVQGTETEVADNTETSTTADATVTDDTIAADEEITWVKIQLSDKVDETTGEIPTGYVSSDYIQLEYIYGEASSMEEIEAEIAAEEAAKKAAEEEAARKAEQEASAKKSNNSSSSSSSSSKNNSSNSSNKKPSTTQTTPTNTNVDDAYLLACVVYLEAGGESYEGQLAVANVVLNRVRNGWGSINSVIYASGQFGVTPYLDGYINGGKSPSSSAVSAANAAIAGTNNIGSYLYFNRTSRVDTNAHPDNVVIGNHCFYN